MFFGECFLFSLILIIFIAVVLYNEWKLLAVITLGKNQAINLGVDYDKTIRRLLLGITLYIPVAPAMVGPISFLGLIIANLSRQLFKTYKHSYLMLGSAFFGIFVLLLGQSLIEHVFEYSATINVFVSIFGGTYFLYLIWKGRKG